ncbi:MAG TPA: hypothetical protein VMF30_01735, partial [Pirellulales bacterium]|nr:hypothetical protein [Pirellulales bacterium]
MNSHGCQVDSFADVDLIHAAYANCGLIELAARGEIELRFRVRDRAIRWWCSPCRLWLHVHVPNG